MTGLIGGALVGLLAGVGVGSAVTVRQLRRAGAQRGRDCSELARNQEALRRRVEVADELARAERERADQASAGMFALLSGLVAAEEATRGQLSAELHDTVAQSLLLARAELADPKGNRSSATELVAEAEEQLRAVLARTRPPGLREADLASAVDGLRRDFAHRYGLIVRMRWPYRAHPLPLATAVTAYRFCQEALLNIVKHADGELAELALQVHADEVTVSVRDQGPGFDPAAVRPHAGRQVGLSLLAERARLCGGTLAVASSVGSPTVVTLRLPLARRLPEQVAGSTGA